MKKTLFFALMALVCMQALAANVDRMTAQSTATDFLMSRSGNGRLMTSTPAIKWTHEVKSSTNAAVNALYVVNTDRGFVIVAGDDRATQVLGYGEAPLTDMNNLPENMLFWLDHYKQQMEYLQAHPGMVVEKSRTNLGVTVAPMLEAMWNHARSHVEPGLSLLFTVPHD